MVQRNHKRCSICKTGQSNVEWFSVNTSGAAFREIYQSNVEWFSVNAIGNANAGTELRQQSVNWDSG